MRRFSQCPCETCGVHIEFDASRLTPETSLVTCPKCGTQTRLRVPEPKAEHWQLEALKQFGIVAPDTLTKAKADSALKNARQINEHIHQLRRDGLIRLLPKSLLPIFAQLDCQDFPTATTLLNYIEVHYPKLLLSKTYGRRKAHEADLSDEISNFGRFAPTVDVSGVNRLPDEPDATPAQKRYLRDLGVREEALLSSLGKFSASQLIDKVSQARDEQLNAPADSKFAYVPRGQKVSSKGCLGVIIFTILASLYVLDGCRKVSP